MVGTNFGQDVDIQTEADCTGQVSTNAFHTVCPMHWVQILDCVLLKLDTIYGTCRVVGNLLVKDRWSIFYFTLFFFLFLRTIINIQNLHNTLQQERTPSLTQATNTARIMSTSLSFLHAN